jgi:RNA polymerase sigma-70 factor (ECF subfamily)
VSETRLDAEEQSFGSRYRELTGPLTAHVLRLVGGDRQLAEDIVQETMLRAWTRAAELPAAAQRPWAFTTARHLAIDAMRVRRARPTGTFAELSAAPASDDIDAALDDVLLADAFQSLSAEHRRMLFDCYFRGQTAARIATDRDLPPGTVRSRIHYALRALRAALSERGVTTP